MQKEIFHVLSVFIKKAHTVGQDMYPLISFHAEMRYDLRGTLNIVIGDQIIFVLEMTIECRRRIIAVIHDILNGEGTVSASSRNDSASISLAVLRFMVTPRSFVFTIIPYHRRKFNHQKEISLQNALIHLLTAEELDLS